MRLSKSTVKKFVIGCLAIFAAGFLCSEVVMSAEPTDQVKSTVDQILSLLRDESLSVPGKREERRKRIMEIVHQRFDFYEMSQRSLAKHWKKISEKDKERFVSLFTRLLENTYIGKVENYSGEEIVFQKELVKKNKAIVNSAFIKNDIETPILYRLKKKKQQWMVYDVVIEGVSLVRNYRTQFDQIMNKEGFEFLLKKLEEKNEKGESAG